jgi:predicted dehydrogenase
MEQTMIRVGLVGLGKMGISHYAILNAHPEIDLAAVCDSAQYVLGVLSKYTGVRTYSDYRRMIDEAALDCVVVATPSKTHAEIVRYALDHDLDVFCEKPFVLDPRDGEQLVELARQRARVTQVGYHYRFVGAFREAKRLISAGAIGRIHHVRAEAYGPVVLRPKGSTWRGARAEGGGCLYDYASHAIDLVNFLVGRPTAVSGTSLGKVFSRDVEDEVYATLHFPDGASGQLAVNWSDPSYRRMTTRVSVWGSNGRITADRQECQIYLREQAEGVPDVGPGWTVRYTTELTEPVWFYLRGEEYSAQIDRFVQDVKLRRTDGVNSFTSALAADRVVEMLLRDAESPRASGSTAPLPQSPVAARRGLLASFKRVFSH